MHTTMFDIPIIREFLRPIAMAYLKLFGWKVEGALPEHSHYVIIGAPHTSNWDVPIALCITLVLRINCYWMGKDSLFRWPFGGFMRWIGGIPIDRSKSNNVVEETIKVFEGRERMVMIIPPEGTRKQVSYWKTGFYHIAHGAGVPIVMGFLDFKRKTGGIGPVFWPTGDITADMRAIQGFYAGISAKYPEKSSLATLSTDNAAVSMGMQ